MGIFIWLYLATGMGNTLPFLIPSPADHPIVLQRQFLFRVLAVVLVLSVSGAWSSGQLSHRLSLSSGCFVSVCTAPGPWPWDFKVFKVPLYEPVKYNPHCEITPGTVSPTPEDGSEDAE